MHFFTQSWGIAQNKQLARMLEVDRVYRFKNTATLNTDENCLVGWGHKKNTINARKIAKDHHLPYWALEDGFISSVTHPSQTKNRLSLIIDSYGIYYDSRQRSGLDQYLDNVNTWCDEQVIQRSRRAMQQCIKLGISKYNQARESFPRWLLDAVEKQQDITLVIDQTFGDCSIEGAQADASDFQRMLDWAIDQVNLVNGIVVIKTHPDVILGKKRGYFQADSLPNNVQLLGEDVSPRELIRAASRIATVSSQMGFEALWESPLEKSIDVHCFGIPFYAQRGLTIDHARKQVERETVTIEQLFAAAMFKYPKYWHPELDNECELEDILNWMQAQFQARSLHADQVNVVGVSLWKRSFIPEFIGDSASKVRFKKTNNQKPLSSRECELNWGMKTNSAESNSSWRMEDGFIRSVGLGADLRRPCSLVVDDLGIYYNGKTASRLENILNSISLNDYELGRAEALIQRINQSQLTKYNVESGSKELVKEIQSSACDREIVLVVGQFEGDLSIRYGTRDITTNLGLLEAVRADFPEAYILFKEHPDVYSGVRPGKLDEAEVLKIADQYITNLSVTSCFDFVSRVCTLCSLTGFEALMRGVSVSAYGLPFYAGWGLTDDKYRVERRSKTLTLQVLVYGALVLYPRYVNWRTRTLTNAEIIIDQLLNERENVTALNTGWLARQKRKLLYLWEALV